MRRMGCRDIARTDTGSAVIANPYPEANGMRDLVGDTGIDRGSVRHRAAAIGAGNDLEADAGIAKSRSTRASSWSGRPMPPIRTGGPPRARAPRRS